MEIKSKDNEIIDLFCILIDWMPQSAVALYIYRVGGFAPQEILLQDLNLLKALVVLGFCLDQSDRSVMPDQLQHLDRSNRLVRPVGRTRPATYASIGQTA